MNLTNNVFVLDTRKRPLMPCRPARANRLLKAGKAAVYRIQPFTIILKYEVTPHPQPVELKLDPGGKTTGIALVAEFPQRGRVVLWAANLHHRGEAIRKRLDSRRSLRRGRRGRNLRHRPPRFLNRRHPSGWLPPSLRSRVDNVTAWSSRLINQVPVAQIHVETMRFDKHKIQNPEVSGTEYQQGELFGYEVREYLLEKWSRRCAYCGNSGVPLDVEHITPRSRGGSDRVSNLTLACTPCNQIKGNQTASEFGFPAIQRKARQPLKDAAVNATRYAIGKALESLGLPVFFWSGGRTKHNRMKQGYPKDHWIDAACVGESGAQVAILEHLPPLTIKATGRGTRQVVRVDKYGFPRATAGLVKRVAGFQAGDLVTLMQPRGKYAGVHTGRLAGVRQDGRFDSNAQDIGITSSSTNYMLVQRGDGYGYEF